MLRTRTCKYAQTDHHDLLLLRLPRLQTKAFTCSTGGTKESVSESRSDDLLLALLGSLSSECRLLLVLVRLPAADLLS